jgi:hypothetical protein
MLRITLYHTVRCVTNTGHWPSNVYIFKDHPVPYSKLCREHRALAQHCVHFSCTAGTTRHSEQYSTSACTRVEPHPLINPQPLIQNPCIGEPQEGGPTESVTFLPCLQATERISTLSFRMRHPDQPLKLDLKGLDKTSS